MACRNMIILQVCSSSDCVIREYLSLMANGFRNALKSFAFKWLSLLVIWFRPQGSYTSKLALITIQPTFVLKYVVVQWHVF